MTAFVCYKTSKDEVSSKLKKDFPKILLSTLITLLACGNVVFASMKDLPPIPNSDLNKVINIEGKEIKAVKKTPAKLVKQQSSNEIDLSSEDLPQQKINNKKITRIDDPLFETNKDELNKIFAAQKKNDKADLEKLWAATIDRNNAIKFAVQKLAIPPEQRKKHSSLMARSVSTLISGASLVPYMVGAGYSAETLALAGGQVASRIVEKKAYPKTMPLTDTELIQLSELVENLQNRIIKNYYGYKSSINELKDCRQKLMIEHKNYSDAISSKDNFYIVVSSALYDDQLLEEMKIKQKIKQYRLELERLAGEQAVSGLSLSTVVYNSQSNVK